jgi:hypothetical protein
MRSHRLAYDFELTVLLLVEECASFHQPVDHLEKGGVCVGGHMLISWLRLPRSSNRALPSALLSPSL